MPDNGPIAGEDKGNADLSTSSEPDDAHSAREFVAKHHADDPDEVNRLIDARVAMRLDAIGAPHGDFGHEVRIKDTTIDGLEKTLQASEKTRAILKERHEIEWRYPKFAFSGVVGVATVLFAVNLYNQYLAVAELKDRASDLRRQVEASEIQTRDAENAAKEARQSVESVSNQLTTLAAERKAEVSSILSNLATASDAANAVHEALSLVTLGHHYLVHRKSPRQALAFANRADERLNETERRIGTKSQHTVALDKLRNAAWALKGQAYVEMDDSRGLAAVAAFMVTTDCQCAEGYHLRGLAELSSAVDEKTDDHAHSDALKAGILSLERAVGFDQDGNPDLVMLAAANAVAGRYRPARKYASDYLDDPRSAPAEQELLSLETQADIFLATCWKQIADFLDDDRRSDLAAQGACKLTQESFGRMQGRIHVQLLHRLIERPLAPEPGGVQAGRQEKLVTFCKKVLEILQPPRCAPTRIGTGDGVIDDEEPPPPPAGAPAAVPQRPVPPPRAKALLKGDNYVNPIGA